MREGGGRRTDAMKRPNAPPRKNPITPDTAVFPGQDSMSICIYRKQLLAWFPNTQVRQRVQLLPLQRAVYGSKIIHLASSPPYLAPSQVGILDAKRSMATTYTLDSGLLLFCCGIHLPTTRRRPHGSIHRDRFLVGMKIRSRSRSLSKKKPCRMKSSGTVHRLQFSCFGIRLSRAGNMPVIRQEIRKSSMSRDYLDVHFR